MIKSKIPEQKKVYLFELDSVRNTDREIILAQKTLYEEIALNGHVVVMTFNQIVDSRGFFSLLNSKTYQECLLCLFEAGTMQISQYGDIRTVTQYLLNALDVERGSFYFSALPLKSSQKHLTALVRRSLIYSDLSEINGYINLHKRTQEELAALFEETKDDASADNRWKRITLPTSLSEEQMQHILKKLYTLLQFVLKISMLPAAYIAPRSTEEYSAFALPALIERVMTFSCPQDPYWSDAVRIVSETLLKISPRKRMDRSEYLKEIRECAKGKPGAEKVCYQYAEAVVNACYNYTLEASIANVSRHYDVYEVISGDVAGGTFQADFMDRLQHDWDGGRDAACRYLKEETNEFEFFEPDQDLPDFRALVRYSEYVRDKQLGERRLRHSIAWHTGEDMFAYREEGTSQGDANAGFFSKSDTEAERELYESYETGEKMQRAKHRKAVIKGIVRRLLSAGLCIMIAVLIEIVVNWLQDEAMVMADGVLALAAEMVLLLAVTEWITDCMSEYFPQFLSLSEAIQEISFLIRDGAEVFFRRSSVYRNERSAERELRERANVSVLIDYIQTVQIRDYRRLQEEAPQEWFRSEGANGCMIASMRPDTVRSLLRTQEKYNCSFGVVYHSDYHLMVADPIEDPATGECYPYERVLPVSQKEGVIVVVRHNGRFVLLRQFRHAIRQEQYAFPRGFAEEGDESAEAAAYRELHEELGDPKMDSLCALGRVAVDSGLTVSCPYVFSIDVHSFSGHPGHENIRGYQELTGEEMVAWIHDGKINDSMTLAAYTLYVNA